MKITFQIRFHTRFGQQLAISGAHPLFGDGNPTMALAMSYKDPETWEATLALPNHDLPDNPIYYNYLLREPDGSTVLDWGNDRMIRFSDFGGREVRIVDSWNGPAFYANAFYTEPFQEVLLKREPASKLTDRASNGTPNWRFSVKAPLLAPSETVCLLGSSPELGAWDTNHPILMTKSAGSPDYDFELFLGAPAGEYKYGVYDISKASFVRFEDGANRWYHSGSADLNWMRDGFINLPMATWKGAGVSIPVFSLRSTRNFGVGEFADLKPLADWCAVTGLQLIQILPVNDTTATHTRDDSYPYAAISAFALHPIYLRLEDIATTPAARAALEKLEPERQRLNTLPALDYETVTRAKAAFVEKVFPIEAAAVFSSPEYSAFFDSNCVWLVPYAVFCCLRDANGTSDFSQWPNHGTYDAPAIAALADSAEFHEKTRIVYFTQFHLHRQLANAAAYAHTRGVILKGDIPIGISRHSADAWVRPELYYMHTQAGAPPDAFAIKGQNWGLLTYNWPRMQRDGFLWWRQRFEQMGRYFDAFRIDHILGFFRIWTIPLDALEGILGYFVPALPVHGREFEERGIPFDRARYVLPFITGEILENTFGPNATEVAERFLDRDRFGSYQLKPEFSTQRLIQNALPGDDPRTAALRTGLFDLVSNVILLDLDAEGDEFHFRFNMDQTSSFKALPLEVQAPLKALYIDYFFRRQDGFWRQKALEKLPALKRSTNMLVCGEDLGLVPSCVPQVMRELGLLSLEVQRMTPKSWTGTRPQFSDPKDAPYLSVVTPSTHDMSTVRGWWEEDRAQTQEFYNTELGLSGDAPASCTPEINRAIVEQHLRSPAMWSIFLLQDLLGMDASLRFADPHAERINVPAVPGYYWGYRMHLCIEDLLKETGFSQQLRKMVQDAGRSPVT